MNPYYQDDSVTLYWGNCRDVLPSLSGITAVVTDPPYGTSFMDCEWDHDVPGPAFWKVIATACLPGAPLLAFGGTRTFHRLACAIEDAGWDLRDTMCWLHSQGYPKNLDISKAIDKAAGAEREVVGSRNQCFGLTQDKGWNQTSTPRNGIVQDTAPATPEAHRWHGYGTALAPAFEPIILAMNPRAGTFAQNAVEHGTGGLNIDGCRVPTDETRTATGSRKGNFKWGTGNNGNVYTGGRWPPNVLLTHDADCTGDACTEACPVRMLDEQSGVLTSGAKSRSRDMGYCAGSTEWKPTNFSADSGTASRFFPRFRYESKASKQDRGPGNTWPTVKPQALMRWLLTLVRQPGVNLVLDPFAGSGTTGVAAKTLGIPCILIDASEAACEIAARRLAATTPSLFQSEPPPSVPTPAPVQTRLDF